MFNAAVRSLVRRTSLVHSGRPLHSTPFALKTVTEKISEVADAVNKKVGKGLASAIETGETATQSTKENLGSAADKADYASNVVGQKTNQGAAGVREAKRDFEREVKK